MRIRLGSAGHWFRVSLDEQGRPQYGLSDLEYFPPQYATEDVSESNLPVGGGRGFYSFRDLSGGAYLRETPIVGSNSRYDRVGDAAGEGVDASLLPDGPILLAPQLNTETVTVDSLAGPRGLLWKGGSASAYFVGDTPNRVYSWDGAAFARVAAAPAVTVGRQGLIPFRGSQSTEYWYAVGGTTVTPAYSTDSGVTWAAVTASTVGIPFAAAISAVVHHGEVIFARTSQAANGGSAAVARFDDGGTTPTGFGLVDPVGDPSYAILRLLVFNDRVVILKQDGIHVLAGDRSTLDQNVLSELQQYASVENAWGATTWRGVLWLPTLQGLYAVGSDWSIANVGPEAAGLSMPTSGSFTGRVYCVGGDMHNLYALWFRSGTTTPYILKANVRISGGRVTDIAWHVLLAMATTSAPQALFTPGAGNRPTLLISTNFSNGSLRWCYIPLMNRDPRGDSDYRYAAAGTLYLPRLTARFPSIQKSFFGITPLAVDLGYAFNGQTSTTALSLASWYKGSSTALTGTTPFGYTQNTAQTSGQGSRDAIDVRDRGLDVAVRLASTDNTLSPQLQSVTVDYVAQPTPLWKAVVQLDLREGAWADDGSGALEPMPSDAAWRFLRTLPASASFTSPDPLDPNQTRTLYVPTGGVKPLVLGPESEDGTVPLVVQVTLLEKDPAT